MRRECLHHARPNFLQLLRVAWSTVMMCRLLSDGRPVYGIGGLDGLGGRAGGQETTSGDWDGLGGREPQPFFAKVRVAGSNPVVRSL
jgi:hypothetical protein